MSEKKIDLTFNQVIKDYQGDLEVLEKAIGTYVIGLKFGWRVMLLVHDRRTLKKYSDIIGIDLLKELPEVGDYAEKSFAWRAAQKVKSYWKAVRGEEPGIKSALAD